MYQPCFNFVSSRFPLWDTSKMRGKQCHSASKPIHGPLWDSPDLIWSPAVFGSWEASKGATRNVRSSISLILPATVQHPKQGQKFHINFEQSLSCNKLRLSNFSPRSVFGVKGLKFQTLGGFRYISLPMAISGIYIEFQEKMMYI